MREKEKEKRGENCKTSRGKEENQNEKLSREIKKKEWRDWKRMTNTEGKERSENEWIKSTTRFVIDYVNRCKVTRINEIEFARWSSVDCNLSSASLCPPPHSSVPLHDARITNAIYNICPLKFTFCCAVQNSLNFQWRVVHGKPVHITIIANKRQESQIHETWIVWKKKNIIQCTQLRCFGSSWILKFSVCAFFFRAGSFVFWIVARKHGF